MATAAFSHEREHYLNKEYGIRSWLLTTDHKRIALLYLVSITFFFFIGGFLALLIRLELLTPAGDLVQADTYNKLFTMHGQIMVFFFLIPSIPAVLGNFLVPLFIWAHYATSIIQLLGTPVLAITLLLVVFERAFNLGIFDPNRGGDPLLFQHLFWFYSHPAVYIMILPAMAVESEVVACFARKRIFGYNFVAMSSIAIAVFGFLVWAHHMFVAGISLYSALIFSILSYLVAVPSAIKVFNWTATMYKGSVSFTTPMLYAFGFIGLFTMGGLTGLFLAALGLDVHVTDTYFVIAHFHYIMVGGAVMGYLGGLHFWWPKISGRMYPEAWGRLAALLVFIGFNLTFFPQFILGYLGMPRRYWQYPPEFQVLNVLSTAGSTILAVGYLLPTVYFLWSMRY